jgi:uncharacterized Tic20 family protein
MKTLLSFSWLFSFAILFTFFFSEGAWANFVGNNGVVEQTRNNTTLPNGDITILIPIIIRFILGIFSILLTGVVIYAGVLFVGNFGDEESITKAKKLLIWSIVGVVISATSYAIVAGVISLDFSQTGE